MMAYDALGTAMLSYTAQNKGAGLPSRIKKGTTQSFIIMGIIYLFVNLIGFAPASTGPSSISSSPLIRSILKRSSMPPVTSTRFLPISFILGVLFIGRNVVQGLREASYCLS
jgi:Na+-driven multidrug efflux pump